MTFTISLKDKSVIVTGASSGIGSAIACAMAKAGANVSAIGRNADKLGDLVEQIADGGGIGRSIVADLTDDYAPTRIVAEVTDAFGGIDCLVNNAGIFIVAPPDVSLPLLDRQWKTNVRAPYALTIAALPALRARQGNVIFLSSIAGRVGFGAASAYCATKGAIEQLTRSLAVEEGPNGVRFNAIAPGNIETPINAQLMADPAYMKTMIENTPAGRNGQASEIAPLSVLLASDHSAFTTGASILVDGGWAAR